MATYLGWLMHRSWWGVAVATLAGLALFMFKRSVMEVIVECAVLGLVKIYF